MFNNTMNFPTLVILSISILVLVFYIGSEINLLSKKGQGYKFDFLKIWPKRKQNKRIFPWGNENPSLVINIKNNSRGNESIIADLIRNTGSLSKGFVPIVGTKQKGGFFSRAIGQDSINKHPNVKIKTLHEELSGPFSENIKSAFIGDKKILNKSSGQTLTNAQKFPHYYKDVNHLKEIDVYRVLDLFQVTNPCVQHAVKKLLVTGKRGAKMYEKDIQEAIVTLQRHLEMLQEDDANGAGDTSYSLPA